jgi:DNA-binding transcriptional regulator YdaS (Cro superfamily)
MKNNPLKKYLLSIPKSSRRNAVKKIAADLKVSECYVYMMSVGSRKILPKHCVIIEKSTKKSILRQDLCPELYR